MKNRFEKQDRVIGEVQNEAPSANAMETLEAEPVVEEVKPVEKEHTPVKVMGKVVNGKLNLRQAPSVSAKALTQIPDGDKVEILEDNGEWYNVKYQNFVGFVKSEFVVFA